MTTETKPQCMRCCLNVAVTVNDFIPGPDLKRPHAGAIRYSRPVCRSCDLTLKTLEILGDGEQD